MSKAKRELALGIDIGGTRIKAVVVDGAGARLHEAYLATGDEKDAYKGAVRELVGTVEKELGKCQWLGISSPGLARRDHQAIAWMRGRMAGVEGYVWGEALGREAWVLNDAHAALMGEVWCGAAAGARDAVMFTLGTGVGGAIMCDGRVLMGHLGRAGHLGHISLDPAGAKDIVNTPGSLEDLIGDHTVGARTAGRFKDTAALVAAYEKGDTAAARIWLTSVRALGAGIASVINAVDPEVVIVGGGIARAGAALFAPLGVAMEEFEWRPIEGQTVRIVPAALDDLAGAIGAARFAMVSGSKEKK